MIDTHTYIICCRPTLLMPLMFSKARRPTPSQAVLIFAAGSALLVPLLAVLLRTPDSDDLPAKIRVAGSSHTPLEHLDEALLHAPWVACARAH